MAFIAKGTGKYFVWLGNPCGREYSFPHYGFYILVAQGYGVTKHKCWNANGIIIHFCQTSRIDPCCLTARTLLGDFTCILLDKPESNLDENLNIA